MRKALRTLLTWLGSRATGLLLGLLSLYRRALSPLLHVLSPGGGCGFLPTCSVYAAEAIRLNGPIVGSGQALRRLLRCHPFHEGGFDPPRRRAAARRG